MSSGNGQLSGRLVLVPFAGTSVSDTVREAVREEFLDLRNWQAALPAVYECIENYHVSEIADWTRVASERYFELSLESDHERPLVIQGYVDAIYRHDGTHYVVDYKTGEHDPSGDRLNHTTQAEIYIVVRSLVGSQVEQTVVVFLVGSRSHEIDSVAMYFAGRGRSRACTIDRTLSKAVVCSFHASTPRSGSSIGGELRLQSNKIIPDPNICIEVPSMQGICDNFLGIY